MYRTESLIQYFPRLAFLNFIFNFILSWFFLSLKVYANEAECKQWRHERFAYNLYLFSAQTSDMQWTYAIIGTTPEYAPPTGQSAVGSTPHTHRRTVKQKKNYIRENLKLQNTAVSSPVKGVPLVARSTKSAHRDWFLIMRSAIVFGFRQCVVFLQYVIENDVFRNTSGDSLARY